MSEMIVTTGDLSRPYEVLDIVSELGWFEYDNEIVKVADEVKEGIKDKARKLEADAVICYRQNLTGVRPNGDYIFAYGTAVRFI